MTVTYEWTIRSMKTAPEFQGHDNVVISAEWQCLATEDQYSTFISGTASFGSAGVPFSDYNTLTQEQVLGWVWDANGDKLAIEQALAAQIEMLKNPPVVVLPNPW
jgi:hypothetical protein